MAIFKLYRRILQGGLLFSVTLFSLVCVHFSLAQEGEESSKVQAPSTGEGIDEGEKVYEKRCSQCHGIEGRGDGFAADRFNPRPANFARGKFKYASTIKEELPTDDDLFRTVSKGLPGTGMPAWESVLSEKERRQVIAYIKTFSSKFAEQEGPLKMIDFGKKIPPSKESLAKGKELFFKMECNRCHGDEGRSDGKNAAELPIRPRNFTKGWTFRRGNSPEEIFQRITRGIIAMPSFAKGENVETTEEERWHIANYVNSLSQYSGQPDWKVAIVAKPIQGEVSDDPDDPRWAELERNSFPLVGQVTIEPRMFTPTVDMVTIKGMYNEKEVALLIIWDDPTNSVAGQGGEEGKEPTETFDDAVAIQFPIRLSEGSQKPYFIIGEVDDPVYVARWNAGTKTIEEFNATGQEHGGGIRIKKQEEKSQQFKGKATFKNGQYRAVFKRSLITDDKENELQIEVGKFIPIAYTAWDGSNGEREGMRSLSAWYYLFLEVPAPPTRFVYPTLFLLVVVGLEWWISRKYRNGENGKEK